MNIVGLKELRQHTARYAALVKRGQSFVVVRRSQPLFKVSPIDGMDGEWEAVVDFTRLSRGGVKIQDILARL